MRWFSGAGHDVRYAIRSLRKSPAFAAVAIVTLALGIGATTAIYSVVDTILLQPLPFADSDRLVRIVENIPFIDRGRPPLQRGVTYTEFVEWRSRTRTLADPVAVIGMAAPRRSGCSARATRSDRTWTGTPAAGPELEARRGRSRDPFPDRDRGRIAGAAAGTQLLQGMLFGITPLDPMTFAAVSVLFGLVAMVASYLPARRATTGDPMVALRSE